MKIIVACLLLIIVAGCATTTGTASNPQLTKQIVCGPWRAITVSKTKDTPETVRQVQVHDQTGVNLGCW